VSIWTGPEPYFGVCSKRSGQSADLATAVRVIADEPDPVVREVLDRTGFRLTDESYSQLRAWIDYAPDADLHRLQTPTLAIYGTQDT
jgi:hypothetical protein